MGQQVEDVVLRAREEVVNAQDLVAALEQVTAEVRAEETGAAGDEDAGAEHAENHLMLGPLIIQQGPGPALTDTLSGATRCE
jgi:hypothetical protein